MRIVSLAAAMLLAAALASCATRQAAPSSVSSTQGTARVQTAQVIKIRDVTVRGGTSSGIGSFAGSVLGAIAGSNIGAGHGRTAASVGGAVAGGVAGHEIQKAGAASTVTELTVRFANGDERTYNVGPSENFRIGDTVQVITSQGKIEVTR